MAYRTWLSIGNPKSYWLGRVVVAVPPFERKAASQSIPASPPMVYFPESRDPPFTAILSPATCQDFPGTAYCGLVRWGRRWLTSQTIEETAIDVI